MHVHAYYSRSLWQRPEVDVTVRYLNGSETIFHGCQTVRDVKLRVCSDRLPEKIFAPMIHVFVQDSELTNDDDKPSHLCYAVIVQPSETPQFWQEALTAHGLGKDAEGVSRCMAVIDEFNLDGANYAKDDSPKQKRLAETIAGQVMLEYLQCGGRDQEILSIWIANADVNYADASGWNALCEVSLTGHVDVAHLLIKSKCDVNQGDQCGWTALRWAAYVGHTEIAKLLISVGNASANVASHRGWTPLCDASSEGHVDVAKILIDAGALVNSADRDGSTPLREACLHGHVELVKLLLVSGADVNHTDPSGNTVLGEAACAGRTVIVNLLLNAGAHVDGADKNGWTPLLWASYKGYSECVRLLISAKADVHHEASRSWFPLYAACNNGHAEVAQVLINVGKANVNQTTASGCTALWAAYGERHMRVVKALISAGIDTNHRDKLGYTAKEAGIDSVDAGNDVE